MAKKSPAKKNTKSFEESLWDTANKLRGSVESSEYKHVVLSLIFLKFVSDKFEERRAELVAERKEDYLDMVEFYTMQNVFYLPETSRWSYIQQHAKQGDIALKIDSALTAVEKSNASLKGALPDNYFSRLGLDVSKLSALIDAINNIDTVEDKEEDTVGRVYEYFLGKFAASEGKLGGEFYTPKCVVNLIAEMIEPYKGKIYDPCCGSGGMFVQSIKFVESHHGSKKDISVYGQEFTATTYKLAKMNLAVRGLSANLGEVPADTFFKDQHPDLKADSERDYRNREGETLFIDARKIGSMISRTQKEFGVEDIAAIARTYHAWRGEKKDGEYEDEAGYCKSATLEDIRKHDYVLTPGRYVGAAALEDDGIPFETKMTELSQTLYAQMDESAKLDEAIRKNLEGLGYGK